MIKTRDDGKGCVKNCPKFRDVIYGRPLIKIYEGKNKIMTIKNVTSVEYFLSFLYQHLILKFILNCNLQIFPNSIIVELVTWFEVCEQFMYRRPSLFAGLRSQKVPRIPKPRITREHCLG